MPTAIAARARAEHEAGRPFKVGVITGASTGPSLDGELAKAEAVLFRTPYQADPELRKRSTRARSSFSTCICRCCRKPCATVSSAR
jgi:acyl-CoA hydrolase